MKKELKLTVLIQEDRLGDDLKFIGQCQEYNICVQGRTIQQLKERFSKTIRGYKLIARERKCDLINCLPVQDPSIFEDVIKIEEGVEYALAN